MWLSRWRSAVSLVLAFSMCPAGVAWATEEALTREVDGLTFDQFVQEALRDYGVPGATVVIANANETVFLKGYGIRSSDAAGAVDENTRFQLASMSKFIAATAVGALVDRGVVTWDAPVRTFSPDTALAVPYATENATLATTSRTAQACRPMGARRLSHFLDSRALGELRFFWRLI